MINRDLVLRIANNKATLNEPVTIYSFDRGIRLNIEVLQYKYQTGTVIDSNFIQTHKGIARARSLVKAPDGKLFKEPDIVTNIEDDKVIIDIDIDWTDEHSEVGKYYIQIQLYDEENSRVTLPPFYITVEDLIGYIYDDEQINKDGQAGHSTVGETPIASDNPVTDNSDIVEGYYDNTEWKKGDIISSEALNKLETRLKEVYSGKGFTDTNIQDLETNASKLVEAINELHGMYTNLNDLIYRMASENDIPIAIEEINVLNADDLNSIGYGESKTIEYEVLPILAEKSLVKWYSDNPELIEVNAIGKITALGHGATTITCESLDNSEVKCEIPIDNSLRISIVPPSGISTNVNPGDSIQLDYVIYPNTIYNEVEWATSDDTIAIVNANGLVTFLDVGNVTIYCNSKEYEDSLDEYKFKVGTPVEEVNIICNSDIELAPGMVLQLEYEVIPAEANVNVQWISDNENVAAVDSNGLVTYHNEGYATIYLKDVVSGMVYDELDIECSDFAGYVTLTYSTTRNDSKIVTNSNSKLPVMFKKSYDKLNWSVINYSDTLNPNYDKLYLKAIGKPEVISYSFAHLSDYIKNIDFSEYDTSNVTNMNNMFYNCESLTSLDLSNFDTSNVTDMSYMFYYCDSLTSIDLSKFNTSNVTNMSYMFYMCSSLTSIDVSNFDTSSVTDTSYMFSYCSSLTSLDVSNFDTSNVITFYNMFSGCSKLTSLDLSNFDTSKTTYIAGMFNGCSKLTSLNISNWQTTKTSIANFSMFSGTNSLETIFADNVSPIILSSAFSTVVSRSGKEPGKLYTNLTEEELGSTLVSTIQSKNYEISAYIPVEGITINQYELKGRINTTSQLSISYNPADTTQTEVVWESDNTEIATVDQNGLVTFIGEGTCNITATSIHNPDISSTISCECYLIRAESVGITVDKPSAYNGESTRLTFKTIPEDVDETYTFSKVIIECNGENYVCDINAGDNEITTDCVSYKHKIMGRIILQLTFLNPGKFKVSVEFNECDIVSSIEMESLPPTYFTVQYGDGSKFINDEYVELFRVSNEASRYEWIDLTTDSSTTSGIEYRIKPKEGVEITSFANLFAGTTITSVDSGVLDTNNIRNTSGMFEGCSQLISANLSNFNTANVTDMSRMFKDCTILESITVGENWDISNVENTSEMFLNCNALLIESTNPNANTPALFLLGDEPSILNVYDWNVSSVKDMSNMFNGCSQVVNMDLSGWQTDNVTSVNSMMANCSNMEVLNVSGWNLENATTEGMVKGCSSLSEIQIDRVSADTANSVLQEVDNAGLTNYTVQTSVPEEELDSEILETIRNNGKIDLPDLTSCMILNYDNPRSIIFHKDFINSGLMLEMSTDGRNWEQVTEYSEPGTTSNVYIRPYEGVRINSMADMFNSSSLKRMKLYNFNTSKVIDVSRMFEGCHSLEFINLTGLDLGNVTDIDYIFNDCTSLNTIELYDVIEVYTNKILECLLNDSPTDYTVYVSWQESELDGLIIEEVKYEGGIIVCPELPPVEEPEYSYMTLRYSDPNATVFGTEFEYYDDYEMSTNKMDWYGMGSGVTAGTTEPIYIRVKDGHQVTTMYEIFKGCSLLTSVDLSNFDTSTVTNMSYMFNGCDLLTSLDLSGFDTSNVTDMRSMFYNCSSLASLDLSSLDTSNVNNMSSMFFKCKSLASVDLSSFDTSNVTSMSSMFYNCDSLTELELSNFDTSNVTNMGYMFEFCYSLASVDLSSFDTSNVTNMSKMFDGCSLLTSVDLSNFDISNVTDMSSMFNECENLTVITGLDNWNTTNVTAMHSLFNGCKKLSNIGDLSKWDVSKVTSLGYLFYYCSLLTDVGDLSNWDVSKVKNMSYMFNRSGLEELDFIYEWNTSSVTNMNNMFSYAKVSSLDLSKWNTDNLTTMKNIFDNCKTLTSLNINFNTSKVTDMQYAFSNCPVLTSLDLSSFDTSKVTTMSNIFKGCSVLTSLDLSNFDTRKVTTMSSMFYECSSLVSLDLSNFDTVSVTKMGNMFYGCSSLASLDLSNSNANTINNILDTLISQTPKNYTVTISQQESELDQDIVASVKAEGGTIITQ